MLYRIPPDAARVDRLHGWDLGDGVHHADGGDGGRLPEFLNKILVGHFGDFRGDWGENRFMALPTTSLSFDRFPAAIPLSDPRTTDRFPFK